MCSGRCARCIGTTVHDLYITEESFLPHFIPLEVEVLLPLLFSAMATGRRFCLDTFLGVGSSALPFLHLEAPL